jgi:pyruvate/2-oxoglutarate dehydrogenase complex dihydrolipoamide dehydrogenase (E3) component
VTILHRGDQLLAREDHDVAALLFETFRGEGIEVVLETQITRVEKSESGKEIVFSKDGATRAIDVDAILVATGRQANVEGLGLEAAGIATGPHGIAVDDLLRTSNRRVYAAGDVASSFQFTHAADAQARIVIQNALFPLRRKASALRIPWSTYTDPEIARVGLSKKQAEAGGQQIEIVKVPFAELDRAILEGRKEGFLRVLTNKRGLILGATIVGENAGDLISEISVAMAAGLTLGKLSQVIHPYPTHAEAVRKAADIFNRRRFGPNLKRLIATYFRGRLG